MKYKVGDKVKIRSDLRADRYNMQSGDGLGWWAVDMMLQYAGETVTIAEVKSFKGNPYYKIEEHVFKWVDGMFEGLAEEPAPELHEDWSWEDLF